MLRTLVLIVLCLTARPAIAQQWTTLTTCGGLEGYAYFFPGAAVPKDAISKGSTTLVYNGKQFDIIFKDAVNRQKSVRFHEKAEIFPFGNRTLLRILVIYPDGKSTAVYTFNLHGTRGNGVLVLSQQREGIVSKVSMMSARCKG